MKEQEPDLMLRFDLPSLFCSAFERRVITHNYLDLARQLARRRGNKEPLTAAVMPPFFGLENWRHEGRDE
jgi:hypothetical protein